MPAALRPADAGATTADDLLGMKWVAGVPANRAAGIAPINALVILSDPATGQPIAVLDGGPITAQRTAAVSGVVVRRFGAARRRPAWPSSGPASRAGVMPRCSAAWSRASSSSSTIAIPSARRPWRSGGAAGIAAAEGAPTAREAGRDADVVISAVDVRAPRTIASR